MNDHVTYADWQINQDSGLCTRIAEEHSAGPKQISQLKNIYKQDKVSQVQNQVVWSKDSHDVASLDNGIGLHVTADFWTLPDAFKLLLSAIKALPEGSDISILLPLLKGRKSGVSFDKSQLNAWPFAHAFTWQTIFSVLHDMGLRNMWRENCESQSAGIYYFTAKTSTAPDKHKLSVVMPIFNEKNTFLETFDRVYNKLTSMDYIDFELIIIESDK